MAVMDADRQQVNKKEKRRGQKRIRVYGAKRQKQNANFAGAKVIKKNRMQTKKFVESFGSDRAWQSSGCK